MNMREGLKTLVKKKNYEQYLNLNEFSVMKPSLN